MSRARLPFWVLTLLALSSAGCGKFRDIRACNGVVHEANSALDEIELLSKQKPRDEPRIAKRYGALAKSLTARAQGETPFAVALREYISVLQATETAVNAHAEASKGPSTRGADARRDLERLIKRERAAASRIDSVCH